MVVGDTPKKPSAMAKKGLALAKSASESSLKKKQQVSLLDQELLVLERDEGKRHQRQLSSTLLDYARKIEDVQAKNRRLEEELSFDDHVTRDDPFYNQDTADKLSNLYLQGNNFMVRLELERKEIARLNGLIQRSESTLALQKSKLYELSALDHNHTVLVGKIRKMEHDIDRRVVKMNEKLSVNRKLRDAIDAQRAERARMDAIYTKMSLEALSKQGKVAKLSDEVDKLREEVAAIESDIGDMYREGDEWEHQCDQRAAVLMQELKEIALQQRDAEELTDVDKYKYLSDNELMKHMNAAHDNVLRSRVNRGRWKTGQAKIATDTLLTRYQENRSFIEKIHEVSGTHTVTEMIDAFNSQEVEHFERIQLVNQLAEDIENHRQVSAKLREEIGKLKQRKDSVDFQRMNRVETLKAKLQSTIEMKKHKEEANHELQSFLAVLKPAIMMLHTELGCPDMHNDGDMKKMLGDVEDQVVNVLQKYSAKMEAKSQAEVAAAAAAATEAGDNQNTSSGKPIDPQAASGSPSPPKRRAHGSASNLAAHSTLPPPLNFTQHAELGLSAGLVTSPLHGDAKVVPTGVVASVLSKDQPYRYGGLRPPYLSVEELKKKDNVEEEYPLTYDELKVKVWRGHGDNST